MLPFVLFVCFFAICCHLLPHRHTLMNTLLLLQETDDEDEGSCNIKECLEAFLRWLRGLSWFKWLRNKRQINYSVKWCELCQIQCHTSFCSFFAICHTTGWYFAVAIVQSECFLFYTYNKRTYFWLPPVTRGHSACLMCLTVCLGFSLCYCLNLDLFRCFSKCGPYPHLSMGHLAFFGGSLIWKVSGVFFCLKCYKVLWYLYLEKLHIESCNTQCSALLLLSSITLRNPSKCCYWIYL